MKLFSDKRKRKRRKELCNLEKKNEFASNAKVRRTAILLVAIISTVVLVITSGWLFNATLRGITPELIQPAGWFRIVLAFLLVPAVSTVQITVAFLLFRNAELGCRATAPEVIRLAFPVTFSTFVINNLRLGNFSDHLYTYDSAKRILQYNLLSFLPLLASFARQTNDLHNPLHVVTMCRCVSSTITAM